MADIDLTPTEEMASNAARGLELREKHGRGGTAVGVARARDIKNRKNLSPDTVRRMHSFFSRHAGNEAGGEDDAGYISFLLWGGAAGRSWAKRKSAQLDKDENAMTDTRKEIMERLGSAGKVKAGRAEQVLRDGTVHLDFVEAAKWIPTLTEQELRGIVADARAAANAQPQGKKWNYYHDLVLTASDELQKRKRKSSRPGAKAKFGTNKRIIRARGHEFLAEDEGRYTRISIRIDGEWEHATTVNSDKRTASEWIEANAQPGNPSRWLPNAYSRPGAKAKMARWTLDASEGWGDLSKQWTATINGTQWAIVVEGATGNGSLMRVQPGRAPQTIKRGSVEQLKRYAETLKSSRPGAKAKMAAAPGVAELERLYAKFQESTRLFTPNKYHDAGEQKRMTSGQKKDFAFFENLLKAARSGDGKMAKALLAKTDSLLTAHFVPKELRVWAAQFAAHGAKAKMGLLTSISTLPNTGSVNMTAKRFLERLYRVNLKDYEGFENFHRELSEVIAGVVRDTNRSMKDGEQYGDWSGKDLAAIIQRKIGRSPALTRTAEAWLGVSMMSRPGAKVRNAADILKVEVMDGSTVTSSMTPSDFMAYAKRSLPGIASTSFLPDMIARFNELAEEKGMRVRVRSNLAKSKNAIREGEKVSASDDAVSRKIRKLMDEGKPQKQAVAIALDLERRGEL